MPANFPGRSGWPMFFCQQSFFPGSRRQRKNDSKRGSIMGHYTIRTNDDEDQAIKKAQEATGQASASKTFMTAILELQRNRDEIAQLRRALAQEKARSQELVASVQQFRNSMNVMFELAGNNKS
ncbi:hypothetical protein [Klebsiella pneumoniae]|uniref:hypothetical protein n=2 Tax=Enterobacterales TaxID=91347 RepID=UPI001CED2DFC|nr:hypothetical protein [Klebsiella pneumoniae]